MVWAGLRAFIFFAFIHFSTKWYHGFLLYFLIFSVGQNFIMHNVLGYELLSPMDAIFNLDFKLNNCIIVGSVFMDKFKYEDMRDNLLKRIMFNKRFRSKLVKIAGNYYFEPMDDEEFAHHRKEVCKKISGIHNEEDITKFLCREANLRATDDHL